MVLDFGEKEPTGYTCAQCGQSAEQYAVLLTDSQLKKFYFDLACAAQLLAPMQDPTMATKMLGKLKELSNRGSVKLDGELRDV